MYQLYQNKYSNYLSLNLIKVRYSEDYTIVDKEFGIQLKANFPDKVNDSITFKLYLFLSVLIGQNEPNNDVVMFDTNTFQNTLKIGKKSDVIKSLDYLKAITYKYMHYLSKDKFGKWKTEIIQCNIIDDYTTTKGYIKVKFNHGYMILLEHNVKTCKNKQFIELPKDFFGLDIKRYRHSSFLAFYIFLNQKRNYGKARMNIVSVKELVKYSPKLPTYEELEEQKQVSRNLVEPFKANMDYLAQELGFEWKYTNTDVKNYLSFMTNKVVFDFKK